LTGVATASDNLGTFSGSTIADNQTVKASLQALETAVEGAEESTNIAVNQDNINDLNSSVGTTLGNTHVGTFTGSTITDNQSVKAGMQELETAVETKLATSAHTQASLDVDHLVTLTGVATASDNLGTFSGSTIADNQTVKASLQALETTVETKVPSSTLTAHVLVVGTLTGVANNADHIGTFTGTTISDDGSIKEGMQELETAVEVNDDNIDDINQTVGVALGAQHVGTFSGSTISDNGTIKAGIQELETAVETKATTSSLSSHTGNTSNPHTVTKSQVGLANAENTAISAWAGSTNLTTVGVLGTGTWQGTAVADAYVASASTWSGKQNALTFGIANTNAIKADSASIADNEYARFTANGLESRSATEVASDIGSVTLASATEEAVALAIALG